MLFHNVSIHAVGCVSNYCLVLVMDLSSTSTIHGPTRRRFKDEVKEIYQASVLQGLQPLKTRDWDQVVSGFPGLS